MKFKGIPYYFVFPGQQDKNAIKEICLYDSIQPTNLILDANFILTKTLNASVYPQAVVRYKNQTVYSGLIDDRFSAIGSSKPNASINYIENALNSLLKNETIKIPYTEAVGCFIESN